MSKKNIIILCGGPPRKNRQRHLELFNGNPLIKNLINECKIDNTNLFVLICKDNIKLINYVKELNINILIAKDEYFRTTMTEALSVEGDCIMIAGDLISIKK